MRERTRFLVIGALGRVRGAFRELSPLLQVAVIRRGVGFKSEEFMLQVGMGFKSRTFFRHATGVIGEEIQDIHNDVQAMVVELLAVRIRDGLAGHIVAIQIQIQARDIPKSDYAARLKALRFEEQVQRFFELALSNVANRQVLVSGSNASSP